MTTKPPRVLYHVNLQIPVLLVLMALYCSGQQSSEYAITLVNIRSGSQVSAITSECAFRLRLIRRRCRVEIVGLAQHPVGQVKGATSCVFIPRHSVEATFKCDELIILPRITSQMPVVSLPRIVRQQYKHLTLADPKFDTPACIDMLIGGDVFPHVVRPRGEILHTLGLPSALDTYLGWVVFGAVAQSSPSPSVSLTATTAPSINELLCKFWTVEELDHSLTPTTEDQLCESLFSSTTQRLPSGQFCVALPFRDKMFFHKSRTSPTPNTIEASLPGSCLSTHGLGDSRSLAQKRFYNQERRLMKNPQLYTAYRNFMTEYEKLGHMELAKQPGKYFIPHHAVLKADGDVSKLRVVFDASAISSSGLSLNDVLCSGPKLQTDIRDILLCSRLKKYIFTADIVKMYRQILIQPEDRLYQHILWRDSPDEEIREFELLTVTYGVNSAPYLAIRCLHELETQESDRFPLAKGILSNSTYVDDIVTGADTEEELLRIQDQIIGLLHTGGCDLKKLTSNCPRILRQIPIQDCMSQTSFDPKDDHSVKVLGLHWDTRSDQFAYHTQALETHSYTQLSKRMVLSVIARLFDPIGALGPMLMWAKSFMQELWQDDLKWDEALPPHLLVIWEQFLSELPMIQRIAVSRHIDVRCSAAIQLLGFSDASKKGYAASTYLRVQYHDGEVKVYYLATKTKVAPLKSGKLDESLSIPRLELCAALLLAQLLDRVYSVLKNEIQISQMLAWTDSTIVLSWLTVDQKHFKIFVTNRVAKIHNLIPECKWAHISTNENPADPASRGLLPSTMLTSSLHWNGPPFLLLPESRWPQSTVSSIDIGRLPETKTYQALSLPVSTVHPIEPFQRFSSLNRMQRVLSYCLRFSRRAQKRCCQTGPITWSELNYVLIIAIQITQTHYFSTLIKQINNSQTIFPASLAQLAPFKDQEGLVRVGGRLRFSSLNEDAKHPFLLPSKAHITTLLIRHYHLSFLHSGAQLTLAMLRRKFWILAGRDTVRQLIFSCVQCVRYKARQPQPVMGDLPAGRVQPHFPFTHVGMDYGGPFIVKESRRRNAHTTKMYLALFVCMSVKAVHLELVTDLSTQAFLAALDRFVARRGIPSDIYSDCGTNYVGAARQIKELFHAVELQQTLSIRIPCHWHFNPPAAPHFGGLWEAGIKSVKRHLKHSVGDQVLTVEEMLTLLTRVEGILNSRPLTQLSTDPSDL